MTTPICNTTQSAVHKISISVNINGGPLVNNDHYKRSSVKNGHITEYEIHPEDFGIPMASNRALKVDTPEQSMAMLKAVLDNQPGAARDIVILNAGAALYAANVASSIKSGVELARSVIASGAAKSKLDQFVAFTQMESSAA